MTSEVVSAVADVLNVLGVLISTSGGGGWWVLYTFDVFAAVRGLRLGECIEWDDKRFLSR